MGMNAVNPEISELGFLTIGTFSFETPDLALIDVVNDADKKVSTVDFIGNPGAFVYEIDLAIEAVKASSFGVEALLVEFSKEEPEPAFRSPPGQSRMDRVTTKSQVLREIISNNPGSFLTAQIDLGIDLPNDSFMDSSLQPSIASRGHKVLFANKPSTVGGLEAGTVTATVRSSAQSRHSSALERDAIQKGIDPLNMMSAPQLRAPTAAARLDRGNGALDSAAPLDEAPLIAPNPITNKRSLVQIRTTLIEEYTDHSHEAFDLALAYAGEGGGGEEGEEVVLGYTAVMSNTQKRIRRRIEISKEELGERVSFFVKISPVLTSGLPGETRSVPLVFEVSHASKVNQFRAPVVAPDIALVKNTPGEVILVIKQLDPTASGITVNRHTYNERRSPRMSPAFSVATKDQGPELTYTVRDVGVHNLAPDTLIYRVTARGGGSSGPTRGIVIRGI